MKKMSLIALVCLLILGLVPRSAQAVKTVHIEHNTEQQFKQGDPCQVIINSTGEISLAYRTKTLLSNKDEVWVVNDIVKTAAGSLYVATSGKGYIYLLKEGQESQIVYGKDLIDHKHVFSLAIDGKGRLLAGTSGETTQLIRFDKAHKTKTLFQEDEIKYVWCILVGPGGRIYLGTGPTGKIITLDSNGKNPEVLYEAKEKNILSLALDADGILYAGGDENGLVYRIEPGTSKTTIVYDTGHGEISGLVFDEAGNLYVSTADTSAARPGAKLILSNGDTSRPESTDEKDKEDKENEKGEKGEKDKKNEVEKINEDQASNNNKNNNDKAKEAKAKPETKENTKKETGKKQANNPEKNKTGQPTNPADKDKPEKTAELIPAATKSSDKTPSTSPASTISAPKPSKPAETNEVYQISPSGYVTSLFSRKVMILSMAYMGHGKLLLGTGIEGELVRLDTQKQEAVVLHTVKPSSQISAVLADADGTVYAGCANPGAVYAIESSYAPEGIYKSQAVDAKQISKWGKLHLEADIPSQSNLKISFRSGNTSDPKKGGWQKWTEPIDAIEDIEIHATPARFLQYRLHFGSSDGSHTAVVREVKLAHMIPNLPPLIKNVTIKSGQVDKTGKSANSSKNMTITWKTKEPNNDKLTCEIFVRIVGREKWIRIAKEIKEEKYTWDSRTVADGRYEVKVTASDELDNPKGQALTASRVSRPIVVDNTPPEITRMSHNIDGWKLRFEATVKDALSVIGSVEYVIDSGEIWHIALPNDGIFDSREENIRFELKIDAPGEHLLAVRFADALGNRTYRNLSVVK